MEERTHRRSRGDAIALAEVVVALKLEVEEAIESRIASGMPVTETCIVAAVEELHQGEGEELDVKFGELVRALVVDWLGQHRAHRRP